MKSACVSAAGQGDFSPETTEWPSSLCQRWCWGSGCGLSSFTCSSVFRPPPSSPSVGCTGAASSESSGIPMCKWNWVLVFSTAGLASGFLGLLSHLLCLQSFIVSVSSKFFFLFCFGFYLPCEKLFLQLPEFPFFFSFQFCLSYVLFLKFFYISLVWFWWERMK